MEKNMNLPNSWITAPLITVCSEIIGGGTPSREVPEYFGGDIVWLTPTEISKEKVSLIHDSREKITQEGLRKSSARLIPPGSVLLTSRASIGYVAISSREVTTNQGFASFVCSESINNFYLAYWLWANKELLENKATGTTFKEISKSKLRELSLPLPPLPEQRRIVSKIDELFSDLDVGVSSLKKAKAELARFRQSVLSHAFSGKLTEDWRKTHGNELETAAALLERIRAERRKNPKTKHKETPQVDASDLPDLPEGWEWTKLNEISEKITDGTHFTPNYVAEGVPFISVKDVRDGKISFADCKYIPQNEHDELIKRCHPEINDVLITKSGTIGRIAVVKTEKPFSLFVSVALIKPYKNHINPEYLAFSLEDYINHLDIQQSVKGGVIKNLHIEDLKEVKIPLMSFKEQIKLVEEIDRRFSIIDSMEKTIDSSLLEANRLRQSILKRAFEGKLVPQDPNDEPANILLERIKKEKS